MIQLTKPLAFLDTETTGLDPQKDRIITLALEIHLPDTDHPIVDEWKFNPQQLISPENSAIHGITNEMVKDWPPFAKHAAIVHGRLAECDFAGFNTTFDLQMLSEEFNRCSLPFDLDGKAILDVGMIYKKQNPRTLSEAVKQYLNREHDGAHGALADTVATREVFEMMLLFHDCLEGKDLAQAAHYSMCRDEDDSVKLDLAGTLVRLKDGTVVYGTKRNRGVPVANDPSYAEWMLRTDFPANTHATIRKVLKSLQT
jgi:DNA polymerase III subunit epsilon